MNLVQKISAYLEFMRYKNAAMAGISSVIAVFIAAIILDYPMEGALFYNLIHLFYIFIMVFLATGAGNMLNDYYDVDIDRVNKPNRPLPSGRISLKEAVYLTILCFSVALLIAFLINPVAGIIGFINVFILIWYAKTLKRTVLLGNLSIAYLTGSTFLFGASFLGTDGVRVMIPLFLLAFLATAAREIVKDIEDIKGDAEDGAVTFPIKYGEKPAIYLASAFGFLAVLLSPLPYILGYLTVHYLYALIIVILCFFVAIYYLFKRDYAKSSKYFKIAMLLSLAAFIFGLI
ncbi:Protoheme IX farnesyltransferase [Methanimicrococcus hongohii]|uniref:Digeranylgeranylglyceryl phosphate synthase n=1 Tax=Methanimicrococcus hongohii TaxID=3028295 RepID=A0AA96ZSU2_9EURY|nr:geranylgeranylglycerol-phosphate geranylgeranyltransferase [Methanimicrococcus sp. Hf6]WNY23780.1 Protoheme IX farnesyltransferase [Methanimicrococcus sp. Hf6]